MANLLLAFGCGVAAYRISIGSLLLIMALGIFFLLRVPDARPHGRGVCARGAAEIRRVEEREKWEHEGI
jgi:hypothetical protein